MQNWMATMRTLLLLFLFVMCTVYPQRMAGLLDEQSVRKEQQFASGNLKVGDYLSMGKYRGETITWRVIDQLAEQRFLLWSEHIISLKSFDSSGETEYARSNLRQWLNSTSMNTSQTPIHWLTRPPNEENVWRGFHPYHNEPGFLSDAYFTSSERATLGTFELGAFELGAFNQEGFKLEGQSGLADYAFLMSEQEWRAVEKKHSEIFGDSLRLAKPTATTVKSSEYQDQSALNKVKTWFYWLRPTISAAQVPIVLNDGRMYESDPRNSVVGVRPAIIFKAPQTKKQWLLGGDGSQKTPYLFNRGTDVTPPTSPQKLQTKLKEKRAIEIKWAASIDNFAVAFYEVYHGSRMLLRTTNTYVELKHTHPLIDYQWSVIAVDAAGNRSEASESLSFRWPAELRPIYLFW